MICSYLRRMTSYMDGWPGNWYHRNRYSIRPEKIPSPIRFSRSGSSKFCAPRSLLIAAVISSTRNPVHAKQKLSLSLSRGPFFLRLLLGFLFACAPLPVRADSLEDAARALARKAASVPQHNRRFYLHWQNHSSVTAEQSESLRESFTDEIGNANIASSEESGLRVLRVSLEETPSLVVLIASVPSSDGEQIRITESPRAARASAAASNASLRLLKELLWQQREPILDAVESVEETNKPSLLLILNRENITLYRRETDHWELLDTKPIPSSEESVRDLRGEIRFAFGRNKQDSVVLPGKTCDLELREKKIELSCHSDAQSWRESTFISSACTNRGDWLLQAESGDWSVPDRLLLQNPSLPKSAPAVSELDLPGPLISISDGPALGTAAATVFNLSSGNYEVYRITMACGN